MSRVEEPAVTAPDPDDAWVQSLRDVLREVIVKLPDHATVGELVDAARNNPHMAPVLDLFTVQELIDIARQRPRPTTTRVVKSRRSEPLDGDDDGSPMLDIESGPRVIRRRADAPDGDIRLLRALAELGPLRDNELANHASLTSDQIRILVRNLRAKGMLHIEGSGAKRRVKITRHGSAYLRKAGPSARAS